MKRPLACGSSDNLFLVTRVSAVKFRPRRFNFFGQSGAKALKHLKASMPCL